MRGRARSPPPRRSSAQSDRAAARRSGVSSSASAAARSRAVDLYVGIASFVALLALWVAATGFEWVQPQFLASPLGVVVRLYDLFAGVNVDHSFIWDIAISLYRVGVAFALSAVLAIPLGILDELLSHRERHQRAGRSISSAICRCRRWCRSR